MGQNLAGNLGENLENAAGNLAEKFGGRLPEILLTNDDGYEAEGLRALSRALSSVARVTIVAPSTEKSACAHSITTTRPMKFGKVDDNFFKLDDGTPSDCVYLGLYAFFSHRKPDLIVTGINHGSNVAEDITYSGTCAGAMEAVLQGIPALAVSQYYERDSLERYGFELACDVALSVVRAIFERGFPLPARQFLNLNIPACSRADYRGLIVTHAGTKGYNIDASAHRNPKGVEYFWIGNGIMDFDASKNAGSDLVAVTSGYASLSPLKLDLSARESMDGLGKWLQNGDLGGKFE